MLYYSAVIPAMLLMIIFGLSKTCFKKCQSPFTKIHTVFNYNFYVRFNLANYFVYTVCYMMAVKEVSFYNWASSLQATVSGLYLLFMASLPLTIIFFYNWNYERLATNKTFRAKWGSLYLGHVGASDTEKTRIAYKYPALQLTRKFIYIFFLVVLHDYWILQLIFLFFSTTMMIYYTSLHSPYQSPALNKLQIFNDMMLVILADFTIAFNGGGFLDTGQS